MPIQAAMVRAQCERTAVKRGRTALAEKRELGSTMRLWSMGVGSCLASRWVCKPEVAGSSLAESGVVMWISSTIRPKELSGLFGGFRLERIPSS